MAFLLNWSILVTCKTIAVQQIHQHPLNIFFKLRFSILVSIDFYFSSQKNTPCKHVFICKDFKIKAEKNGDTVTTWRTPIFQPHASSIPSAIDYTILLYSFIRSVIPKQHQLLIKINKPNIPNTQISLLVIRAESYFMESSIEDLIYVDSSLTIKS